MVNTSRDKQRTWLIQVEINKEIINTSRDKQRTLLIQVEINKEHG